jgi:hypothetical protein
MAYLIRTQVLHRVDIVKRELVAGDERIDPLQGGLEVPELVKTSKSTERNLKHMGTYLLAHWETNHTARPPQPWEPERLGNCECCNQLGRLPHILSDNTRAVRCKVLLN